MISRRQFIWASVAAGGGLALGLGARPALDMKQRLSAAPTLAHGDGYAGWIEIGADDLVRVKSTLTEMGQGVWRMLAQIVAEELDAQWSQVHVDMAPAYRAYDKPVGFGTGGSSSTQRLYANMRTIAATARLLLVETAAQKWNVAVADCTTKDGAVTHAASQRTLRYGELAAAAAKRPAPAAATPKALEQWKLLGQSLPPNDLTDLISGRTQYGIDLQLPDMLVATVSLRPLPDAQLEKFDRDAAMAISGVVKVVELDDGIAVVAKTYWQAQRGLQAAAPQWRLPVVTTDTLREQMFARVQTPVGDAQNTTQRTSQDSTQDSPLEKPRTLTAIYEAPLVMHAQMEPLNATARVSHLGAELWVPTQSQGGMQNDVAKALGLWSHLVTINTPRVGGGFGRRLSTDYGVVAALIARHFDVPVKVIYSREEDSRQGRFRPMAVAQLSAQLADDGAITTFATRVASIDQYSRREGLKELPYTTGPVTSEYLGVASSIRTGPWRSVDASQNRFFREGFIDECALASQRDPLLYRIDLLANNPRAQRVLTTLGKISAWETAQAQGRHLGVAFSEGFGSLTALAVEVLPAADKHWRIGKVFAVIDCGLALNPDGIRAQLEGGVLFGLSAAIQEAITYKDGKQQQINFDSYRILQMKNAPEVVVEILESPESALGGIGETGVPPAAPALANALFAATGVRLRVMPFAAAGLLVV